MNRFITASLVLVGTVIGYLLGRSKLDQTQEKPLWVPVQHGKRQVQIEQVGERVVFYLSLK
jgi:membrane protein YqaA with SNARE-associated domain